MAWTLDLDDYNNKCCRESFPLLKNINREFGYLNSNEPTSGDCSKPPIPSTPPSVSTMTTPDTGEYIDAESSTAGTPTSTSSTSTTQQTWWSQPVTKPTTEQTWWPTQTSTTTSTSTTTTTTSTTTKKPKPSTTSEPSSTTTTTTTTTIKPSTTTIEKDIDEDNDVTSCNTGDYKPVKGNCNAYYRCILGEFRKEHCAGSLHWNNEIKICDWPENAKCKEEITDGSSTTIVIPSSSTTTQRPDEWWTQPTMTWWSEAITTSTTTTTKRPTIWWSPDTKPTTKPTTVFTSRPTTTRPKPKPTTTSTTTANPSTTVQAPAVTLPPTPCNNGQYYPVAGSCTKFAVCFNGALISQQCGPGLYWNQQQGMCDWSYNVDCHENYRLALQWWKLALNNEGVGQQINTRVGGEDSACSKGQFAPHPTNCNKYLQCQWGLYEIYSCPPGLHWNSNRQICDWPANSHCDSKAPAGPGVIQSEEESHTEEAPKLTSSPKPAWTWTTPSTTEWSWTPSTPTTKPTKPNRPHKKHPLSGHFKVVCYFTNWAWYRQGIGKYFPEDVDTDLCTHIQYGFAVLDYENLVIKPHDSWADIDNRFYERVVELKDRGIKVLLAIGGWNDSEGDKYSRLVNNPGARQRFIQHIVQFLKKYDFDGLDLDWEYPKCWQVNCDRGPESDKANFGSFVKEIKAAFKPHKLLLSAAVSPSKTVIDAGYDVKAIAESLDWVSVMTYDYHGQWDKKTGHVAPMYYHPDDTYDYFNSNFSINYWIQEGVPPRKLVMGMPLYGQSFRLSNVSNNGLNAPASGPGEAGEQTAAAGFLAYYEICDRVNNKGWTVVQDPEHRMGPYAYKNEQWVSFDDQPMIKRKSEYIRKMNLGGGMIWALDLDDFRNRCGGGEYTLLKTIASTLAKPPKGVEMVTEAETTTPETTTAESPANVTQVLTTTTEGIDELIAEEKLNKVPSYFYNEQLRKAILCELQPNFCKGNMGTKKK